MRMTLHVDDQLLKEAEQVAAQRGQTLPQLVEQVLRVLVTRPSRNRVELPTFKGRGLRKGVDLDDSAALRDLMEQPDAAD